MVQSLFENNVSIPNKVGDALIPQDDGESKFIKTRKQKNKTRLCNRIRGQSAQIGARDGGFPEGCCQKERKRQIQMDLYDYILRTFQVLKESLGLH